MKLNGSDYLRLRAGLKTPELVQVAKIMEGEGLDAVEVSVGHYESGFPVVRGTFGRCLRNMVQGSARYLPGVRRFLFAAFWPFLAVVCNLIWRPYEGYNLRYARQFKQALSIPVLCVGGFLTRAKMEAAIEQNQCDAVTVGRGSSPIRCSTGICAMARRGRVAWIAMPASATLALSPSTATIPASEQKKTPMLAALS